jgi:hypothetical protein
MNEDILLGWLIGLFEGEGTFIISNGNKPKAIAITSTDYDVLSRVVKHFGGTIYKYRKNNNKPSWKDVYLWRASIDLSIDLAKKMRPFLLGRRSKRCDEFIAYREIILDNKEKGKEETECKIRKVKELRAQGWTHKNIANEVGYDRTYVTRILNNKHKR